MGALTCSMPRTANNQSFYRNSFILLFNLGRILTYTTLGLVSGFVGNSLGANLDPTYWRIGANLLAGLSMILLGLYLAERFSWVRSIDVVGAKLWKRLQPVTLSLLPITTPGRALVCGAVWGWLPCGLVYYALILALSIGDMVSSALFMFIFGLGTMPALVATGVMSGFLVKMTRQPSIRYLSSLIIIAFGCATLYFAVSHW